MFKTFLSYYKPYKGILLFLVIGSLLRTLLELFFPYVVKLILEQQLPLKNLPLLLEWSAALLAMYLVNFGMHFSIIYWAQSMSYSMERDMRRDLFSHLQKLSFGFYDKNKSGQLLSRLTSDLSEINGFAGNAPIDLIVCGLTMLGTMVIYAGQPYCLPASGEGGAYRFRQPAHEKGLLCQSCGNGRGNSQGCGKH